MLCRAVEGDALMGDVIDFSQTEEWEAPIGVCAGKASVMIFEIVIAILIVLGLIWLWPLILLAAGALLIIAIAGVVVYFVWYGIQNHGNETSDVILGAVVVIISLVTYSLVKLKIKELGSFGNALAYFRAWAVPAFGDEAVLRKMKRLEGVKAEATRLEKSKADFAIKLKKERLNQLERRITSELSQFFKEAAISHTRGDHDGLISIRASIPYDQEIASVLVSVEPKTESSAICVIRYFERRTHQGRGIELSDARGIKFLKKRIIRYLKKNLQALNSAS